MVTSSNSDHSPGPAPVVRRDTFPQMRAIPAAILGGLLLFVRQENPPAKSAQTVRDGVYTEAQAKRGEIVYGEQCVTCHGVELDVAMGPIPPLAGAAFMASWKDATLADLVERQQKTMPPDSPGKMTPQQHVDVVSYVLRKNKFPAGKDELPLDPERLKRIRFR